jgi:hypothetical protein
LRVESIPQSFVSYHDLLAFGFSSKFHKDLPATIRQAIGGATEPIAMRDIVNQFSNQQGAFPCGNTIGQLPPEENVDQDSSYASKVCVSTPIT